MENRNLEQTSDARASDARASDAELIDRYVKGDVTSFEEILARYEGPLLRYVSRYGRERAQDVVQETFLRFLKESPRLSRVQNFSAWLYRVAKNLAIDESRKEQRMSRRHQLVAVPDLQTSGPGATESGEMNSYVTSKLMGLPERQRDVLILKIQEEKSYREISEITGLTISNVGYLIHTGLKSLAGQLRAAGMV